MDIEIWLTQIPLSKLLVLGYFKNITLTLSNQHQHWLAYHIQTGSVFGQETTLC